MTELTVTAVDTRSIQSYVFNSNALKHIAGASFLVHQATHTWVSDAVQGWRTNLSDKGRIDEKSPRIEDGELDAELIYSGGGNAFLLFRSPELAVEFARRLTRRSLLEAPGLKLSLAHHAFDWHSSPNALKDAMKSLFDKLDENRANMPLSASLLGLGVTADCQFTGLPAVTIDGDGKRISAEIRAKELAFAKANTRLNQELLANYRQDLDFVYDFSQFGDPGQSYIAVVHCDGNGMGERNKAVAASSANSRDYIQKMYEFSQSIENTALSAMRSTIQVAAVAKLIGFSLPLRPIVFGGDDTTFVADGSLGLSLAAHFVRTIQQSKLSDGKYLYSRAGVAIVKSHYPFASAYALAEELSGSAKKLIAQLNPVDKAISAIDWHIATSSPLDGLINLRSSEYLLLETNPLSDQPGQHISAAHPWDLLMRPVHFGGHTSWHSWENLMKMREGLLDPQYGWTRRRSKLMALREQVRSGPEAVKQFLLTNPALKLPGIPGFPQSADNGWAEENCTCLDAIELLEYYTDLEGKKP